MFNMFVFPLCGLIMQQVLPLTVHFYVLPSVLLNPNNVTKVRLMQSYKTHTRRCEQNLAVICLKAYSYDPL